MSWDHPLLQFGFNDFQTQILLHREAWISRPSVAPIG
jgi:hypothetical protein